jgi:hypothetical protein
MESKKLTKHFVLYDAETKRNHSKTLKLNDFASEEELLLKKKELQEEQKEKNRLYRQTKRKIALEQPLVYEERNIKPLIEPIKNLFNGIEIKNTLNLRLDANTGNTMVILGSSKRGKSTLMMEIYKQYYKEDKNFISTLFAINDQIPIYRGHKELIISNCFNTESIKYIKLQKYINNKTKNEYSFLNMFDDVIDIKHSKIVNQLILSYRNSNMSCIISLQYAYLVSKMMRANVNNIAIFDSNSNESITDLINLFLKPFFVRLGFKDYETQMTLFKYLTQDHGFILIHPMSDSISFHRLQK